MAFGILVLGMLMGLMAAAVAVPSEAGLLFAAASYIAVGSLTFMSVIVFAILSEPDDRDPDRD